MKASKRRLGFTLVELLTVVAVIAVLSAVLVPTVGKAIDTSKRSKDANHLRQIALAYISELSKLPNASSLHEWAGNLAQLGDYNQAGLWISEMDPVIKGLNKPQVVSYRGGSPTLSEWTLASDFEQFPLSYTVAGGIHRLSQASTTPVAWTRGLQADGTWNANTGVYGNLGGYVAYLDGHVEWYSNLSNERGGKLVNYQTQRPTVNIEEALPPGASVLDSLKTTVNN